MQLAPIFLAVSFLNAISPCLHKHYCLSQCSSQENYRVFTDKVPPFSNSTGIALFLEFIFTLIILTAFFYQKTNTEEILNTLFYQVFFIQLLNFPARILVLATTVSGLCILRDFCSVLQIYHRTDEAQSE